MNKQKDTKLFAFKLAEKKQDVKQQKWTARDNVATAACTGPFTRASTQTSYDGGVYC
ncbi:MAG: hypothetical protein VX447_00690 [Pseudomonadota bacterium]|uniref:hypothetical protein n=1 Tax=Gallaecimonas pentaromativorans TaxID=584787 RepID=UPI0018DE532D|nr:hypothetical protein [Gallaecimonas pentaromativorans]MED5523260.1 hypothetical protein [Pseudomonadota bacterium]